MLEENSDANIYNCCRISYCYINIMSNKVSQVNTYKLFDKCNMCDSTKCTLIKMTRKYKEKTCRQ